MHCSQAVFRAVFKYFFDEELSWEKIDEITKTIPGRGSWTMAVYIELAKRGIEIINFEPFDYQRFEKEGIEYLKSNFSEETVKWYLEHSNLMSVQNLVPEFLNLVHHETRKATIEDIDRLLSDGYILGAEINSRVLNKKPGFSLHYVLIQKGTGNEYTINDPGGGSAPALENRIVSKIEFMEALGKDGSNGEVTAMRRKVS